MKYPRINTKRLNDRIDAMAKIGGLSNGGVHRLTLTKKDKEARDLLIQWLTELGLEIMIDEIGNVFGIHRGKSQKYIGTGSHLDSVPDGGRYDGPLGVLAALEAVETILEHNIETNHSIVVANYTNEEGVRFFPDMMGSLAHTNPANVDQYLHSKDSNGQSVLDELKAIGYSGSLKCGSIPYAYFIELHIEQGPILEDNEVDIGVVKGVQAIHWSRLTIEGRSGHAGTTPIAARRDTFYALSRLSNYARQLCREIDNQLITIGSIQVFPNAINVIPEKIVATLDTRNPHDANLAKALLKLEEFMTVDESFQGIKVHSEQLVHVPAVTFHPEVVQAIETSCKQLGLSSQSMFSGAGHDAQILGTKYPAAMIFIPSKNGISHAVDEYSSPEQIEKGANVLLSTLLALDTQSAG